MQETSSEEIEQDDDENTFVVLHAITDEVKFFDNQEIELHYDDSMIILNANAIKKTENNLREKLILYHKESNENTNTMQVQGNKDQG